MGCLVGPKRVSAQSTCTLLGAVLLGSEGFGGLGINKSVVLAGLVI